MKVKVVSRSRAELDPRYRPAGAVHLQFRNADPELHPFERARELQRALVAAKMEKIFAKPLVGVLDGHRDAVRVIARCHTRLCEAFTGSCDGEIRHWNIAQKRCFRSIRAHEGFVRGLISTHSDTSLLSCGDDGIVRAWNVAAFQPIEDLDEDAAADPGNLVNPSSDQVDTMARQIQPTRLWTASGPLTSIDHHWTDPLFVTTGETVDVWDHSSNTPVHSFDWNNSADAVFTARFNPAETSVLAASGGDNAVALYDLRSSKMIKRLLLKARTNALAWNPMTPLDFVAACEDSNLYTFDLRKLEAALVVHKDFTGPVMDVDFSPTGREFVAGCYDQTVRIFASMAPRSREIYHAKRMQTVLACRYTADSKFIMSGSADFCVRIWKNKAWQVLGPVCGREKRAIEYREALKQRYKNVPVVRRILSHRHVPRLLKKTTETQREMAQAEQKKQINRELHSTPQRAQQLNVHTKKKIFRLPGSLGEEDPSGN